MILDKLASVDGDRDPTSGFWYGDAGYGRNAAGVSVNQNWAETTLSACWACTRALAAPGSYLPFNLHRRLPNGGSELADSHPVHRLIHDAPNIEMGAMPWRAMGLAQQVNSGNTFAEIERTNAGAIIALWPIHPSRVEMRRYESGQLYYSVRNDGEQRSDVPLADMFHVPSMMSDTGLWGKGVIRAARETMGHSIATEQYGASWFGSGGRLSAVLSHPKRMDKPARDQLRKEWRETYGGADAEKVGVLWEGMTYTPIASGPEDSQFIASRQHNIEEICRWYGVPPHMVQHLLRATFNNIEELGLEFVRYALLPWLKMWEQEVWRKLLTPVEQRTYYAKHNVDALERGDLTKRTAALAQQFFNGAITINEWMTLEDRNPIGAAGDVRFVQSSMVRLETAASEPEPVVTGSSPEDQGKALLDKIDAYAKSVQAGAITPQKADEAHYRAEMGLPPISSGSEVWEKEHGIRRPNTLTIQPLEAPEPAAEPVGEVLSVESPADEASTEAEPAEPPEASATSITITGEDMKLIEELSAKVESQAQDIGATAEKQAALRERLTVAANQVYRDACRRILGRERELPKIGSKKHADSGAAIASWYVKQLDTATADFRPVETLLAAMNGRDSGEVDRLARARAVSYLDGHKAAAMQAGAGDLEQLINQWEQQIQGSTL